MSDDYDEVEEFEQEEEEADVADDAADSEDAIADDTPKSKSGGKAAPREELSEHSIAARQALRDEMERQVQEFLAGGGQIAQIDANVTADPPRKPGSDYGGRSI